MSWSNRIVCSLLLLFVWNTLLTAQNRSDLEARRKQLIEEIQQTTHLLEETKRTKASALDRYFALQAQINKRQELIRTLRSEIAYADTSIFRTNDVIFSLNNDVQALKTEYAQMLRTAFRHKQNQSFIFFLFSANNINDVFKRWRYIRQYDQFRKRQAHLIVETQKTLQKKLIQLEEKKVEKEVLLTAEQKQKEFLSQELNDKNMILQALKADEKRLSGALADQQKAHQKLNDAIESVIRGEMARKRKEARNPESLAGTNTPTTAEVAEVDMALSSNFQGNKGRLPWPVKNGIITRYFGTQAHPTQKKIKIINNGIDIQAGEQSPVQVIFGGTVAGTQFIPGYQHTVIVQHGDYYTVYSNLEEIYVKRGDAVNARQTIGRLSNTDSEVHFEIWREKQRLNPVEWVGKQS